jgi:hypothetical protein
MHSLSGASDQEIVDVLSSDDEDIVTRAYSVASEQEITAARKLFRSFGSCNIRESLDDLKRIGLEFVKEE